MRTFSQGPTSQRLEAIPVVGGAAGAAAGSAAQRYLKPIPSRGECGRCCAGCTDQVDVMQLHNVTDPRQDLAMLREWKAQGLCRYTGITTTEHGDFAAAPAIEVRLAGAVVRVVSGMDDAAHLTAVLRAIRASASRK